MPEMLKVKKALMGLVLAVIVMAAPVTAHAATLAQRVAKVEAKLACMQYAGLSEWGGYAPYAGGDGIFAYDPYSEYTAASFDTANGYPHSAGDYRVVVVKDTAGCRARFHAAPNYYGGFFAARSSAVQERVEKIRVG